MTGACIPTLERGHRVGQKKQPKGLPYNKLELASGAQILFESKAQSNLKTERTR